jgi:hypothetical protein
VHRRALGPASGEARARSYGGRRIRSDRTLGPAPESQRASLSVRRSAERVHPRTYPTKASMRFCWRRVLHVAARVHVQGSRQRARE